MEDANTGTDTQDVTVTITGANEAPVISVVDVDSAIKEGETQSHRVSITVADLDLTDLPAAARKYLEFLEQELDTHIIGVSVGCHREEMIWTPTGVST